MTETRWQESAGSLLLLAAAKETGLVSTLVEACPSPTGGSRLAHSQPQSRQQLLLTLLFLGAVGLDRPWDLRGYSGDGLGLLSGRQRAYGYVHTERFLSQLGQADGDEALTEAVAIWTHQLWGSQQESVHYVDMHRKPVYSNQLLPRGKIGRTGKVLSCRAIGLLHDGQGHPLLATTGGGDSHLTRHLPGLVTSYQQAVGEKVVKQLIVDREGMGAEFLESLKDQYQVVTLLRSNQYKDLTSFAEVGEFEPLLYDRNQKMVCEVASAGFALPLPNRPEEFLPVYVALIRDWRRQVPVEAADDDQNQVDILPLTEAWWEADWQASPLPAPPTSPKLIPVISTEPVEDVVGLAELYKGRWRAQENIIRDFLLLLGLDNNHGYHKKIVENSEVAKRRAELQTQLGNIQRWRKGAFERSERAGKLYHRRWDKAKARGDELYRQLNDDLIELQLFEIPQYLIDRYSKTKKRLIEAELDPLWQGVHRADKNNRLEWDKGKRYVVKERKLLRILTDLNEQERTMYQLDDRKDQIMTILRLALTNLVMWTRDLFFPENYAQATWKRLAPFFRLPGHIVDHPDRRLVYLRRFNDRQLNRDLDELCERVNQVQPRLPDGRFLEFFRYKY